MTDFLFFGSKITADGGCSHVIRGWLLLGRKALTNLDSVFKSRDVTLPTRVHIVKCMVFSVVMYGCDSWTRKKAEPKNWCLWTVVLEKTPGCPCTARRSNQSILKETNPEHSLEGLMLKLKLRYFGHLIWTADSLVKSLMLGKIEGRRKRGHQRMRWLDGITHTMDMNLANSGRCEWGLTCYRPWGHKELDTTGWLKTTNSAFQLTVKRS